MTTDIPGIQENVHWCLTHLAGPGGEKLSYPGFAQYAAEHELPGSEGSLRQLDTGWRRSPGAALLASISSYFAIPLDFCTNEQVREAVKRLDVEGQPAGHST